MEIEANDEDILIWNYMKNLTSWLWWLLSKQLT